MTDPGASPSPAVTLGRVEGESGGGGGGVGIVSEGEWQPTHPLETQHCWSQEACIEKMKADFHQYSEGAIYIGTATKNGQI